MKTIIGVNGACGRMGQRIVQLAHDDKALQLGVALDSANHPAHGRDIGEVAGLGPVGVPITSQIPVGQRVDVVIDFSTPAGTMAVLPTCVDRKIPLVVATTGFTADELAEVDAAAHHTALLLAPNMSLVVNVLFKLVKEAAAALKGKDFDVEIIERHHRFKKDSPSGTAGRGWSANGRGRRSACTPSAQGTTSASTPSSSAPSARRWSWSTRATPATPTCAGRWPPPSSSPTARPAGTR